MYDIDSGNGYTYGEDPAVEQMKKEQSEKEEKNYSLDKSSNYDRNY